MKKIHSIVAVLLLTLLSVSPLMAQEHDHHHHHHNRPDAFAPAGVMGDHLHPKGGLMLSLRSMHMFMDGNINKTSSISTSEVNNQYMMAPEKMLMNMYMLGIMYAPTERLTLMAMQNYIHNEMDMQMKMTMMGKSMYSKFSTQSSGIGDLRINALYRIFKKNQHSVHLNTGLNIPIGKTDLTDNTPMKNDARLPYAMQAGSGTWDIIIVATYTSKNELFSWGIQQLNTLPTGNNKEGYRLGNTHLLNAWVGYRINSIISTSVRLNGVSTKKITGEDKLLNSNMSPAANTNSLAGEIVNGLLGINLFIHPKIHFGCEAGLPVYQNYKSIHMDNKFAINGTLRFTLK